MVVGSSPVALISSLEIISGVKPNPNIFLSIATSLADATAVNPNGIKRLLTNGLSPIPIKNIPFPYFSNGPKNLPKNPPDCPILYN